MISIYIGDRLGLYRALAEGGPATSAELAARTGTHERYIREWLEQQTVAGILDVVNENHGTETRRFRIPAGHVKPLIDCGSLNYIAPLAQLLVGAIRPMPLILNAFRNGGGVPLEEYGADFCEGQAAVNRLFPEQEGSFQFLADATTDERNFVCEWMGAIMEAARVNDEAGKGDGDGFDGLDDLEGGGGTTAAKAPPRPPWDAAPVKARMRAALRSVFSGCAETRHCGAISLS